MEGLLTEFIKLCFFYTPLFSHILFSFAFCIVEYRYCHAPRENTAPNYAVKI